ncbi:hypothetical protein LTR53_001359 [Teratosphaeriaceae sp. CCFEE 6253]|nr:hypothetical protein LTR53_001359 [Teratosphaeriaceae sp. CCFEE 6253]
MTSLEEVARDLAVRASEQLREAILDLLQSGVNITGESLQLECNLTGLHAVDGTPVSRFRVASVALDDGGRSASATPTGRRTGLESSGQSSLMRKRKDLRAGERFVYPRDIEPKKRRRVVSRSQSGEGESEHALSSDALPDDEASPRRRRQLPDNAVLQPSTLDKFITGVWDSLFGGIKLDPTEVIEQWQAIESNNGQPRLLADTEKSLATLGTSSTQGLFERMNVLTRRVSQTSRTCRSLEVIVQAHWIQCFDDRVAELTASTTREKAKKQTIAEACIDFSWTEKELRNRIAIWRGYSDIKNTCGWAAIVFAGPGLYRFCKYRNALTEGTFETLTKLAHRFEVAADTLHPRWRQLLAIIGGPAERKYTGHPHDWVVNGPDGGAIPLPQTYHQWNKDFAYTHIDEADVDVDVWGPYDPRTVATPTATDPHTCETCGDPQSDDPRENHCHCFPNLYAGTGPGSAPVQIFRTPDGKNNGLLACAAFEPGAAVGEFVGEVTSGLANLDVMIGQTERTAYQIFQGRRGNHTRFINHSCAPNSEYERFVWRGTQRIVLVSKGIRAGEEVTVDYSDTYWENLDKICLCGHERCRYKDRNRHLLTPPASS